MNTKTLLIRGLTLGAIGGLCGCMAVLNPHHRPPEEVAANVPICSEIELGEGLCRAINRVETVSQRYHTRLEELSRMRNSGPLIGLPLSAVAAYRAGIGVDAQHAINLTAVGTGALVLGDRLYRPTTRQDVFIAGIAALNCVLLKSRPLWLSPAEGEKLTVLADDPAFATLDGALARVRGLLAATPDAAVQARYDDAIKQRDAFGETRKQALQVAQRLRVAPNLIDDARRAVEVEVDKQLVEATPSIDAVLQAVKGLPALTSSIAESLSASTARGAAGTHGTSKGQSEGVEGASKGFGTALADLDTALVAAVSAHTRLQFQLQRVTALGEVPDLAQVCAVPARAPQLTFIPDVPNNSLELKVNEMRSIAVVDGDGVPVVNEYGDANDALETKIDLSSGTVVVMLKALKVTTAPITLSVIGADGKQRRAIVVTVAQAAEQQAATATTAGQTLAGREENCPGETSLDGPSIEKLQRKLNVTPTSPNLGPMTRAALKKRFGIECVGDDAVKLLGD